MFVFRRVLVVVSAYVLLGAAQPSWRAPGACLTPTGTSCRTLEYESSGWTNRGWGFFAIERYSDRETEAVGSDGATMLRIFHRSFRFFVVPSVSYDRTRIVLPAKLQTFEIEHSLKEYRELGGLWQFSEYWTDEPDCSKRAAIAGEMRRKTGEEPTLAGVRAVEYVYESADHRFVQRISFAPSLGCTAVAFNLSTRNAAGLPTSEDDWRLVSATLGEPDRTLFAVPSGYRVMRSEKPWPYISMNVLPGNITTTGFSTPGDKLPRGR